MLSELSGYPTEFLSGIQIVHSLAGTRFPLFPHFVLRGS